ncbi:unnamed protein product [Peniophora sp. CBMAI 1063]|nr:unnamed protein product [Peniophora sp. CBMAI 1063]
MLGFKNFAVVGAGLLGGPITEELLKLRSNGAIGKVVLLTRPQSASKYESFAAQGATIVPVTDYHSTPEVSKALAGIDVVISTVGHAALFDVQVPIAKAAKEAGVQLFVPSEFASPTDNATEGFFAAKAALVKQIRDDVGIPTAVFFTGGFSDTIWGPFFDLDFKSGSVGVGGDGNAKASFTSRTDIARYVAYVLTALPPSESKNKTFRIEGERASLNEIFAAYEKKYGVKLQVKYTSVEELQKRVKENPQDIVSFWQSVMATGGSAVGSPLDNGLFPDWNPKPVIDFL